MTATYAVTAVRRSFSTAVPPQFHRTSHHSSADFLVGMAGGFLLVSGAALARLLCCVCIRVCVVFVTTLTYSLFLAGAGTFRSHLSSTAVITIMRPNYIPPSVIYYPVI